MLPKSSNRSEWPSGAGRFGGSRLGIRTHLEFRLTFDDVAGQDLAHHHVRVGATEAEAGHAGQRVAAVARPVGRGVDDLQVHRVEVDVRAGSGEVDGRRQLVVLQRQHHLGHARPHRQPTPYVPHWFSPRPAAPDGRRAAPGRRRGPAPRPRSGRRGRCRCRAPRCSRRCADRCPRPCRPGASTSACASWLGAIRPLDRPSWLTQLPAMTARIWSPSRRASATRLSTSMPPPSERV